MLGKEFLSFSGIDEEQWVLAVACLRKSIPAEDLARMAREIETDGADNWVTRMHFPLGMGIRNLLRRGGFDEGKLRVTDLDGAWGHLLVEAVGVPHRDAG